MLNLRIYFRHTPTLQVKSQDDGTPWLRAEDMKLYKSSPLFDVAYLRGFFLKIIPPFR